MVFLKSSPGMLLMLLPPRFLYKKCWLKITSYIFVYIYDHYTLVKMPKCVFCDNHNYTYRNHVCMHSANSNRIITSTYSSSSFVVFLKSSPGMVLMLFLSKSLNKKCWLKMISYILSTVGKYSCDNASEKNVSKTNIKFMLKKARVFFFKNRIIVNGVAAKCYGKYQNKTCVFHALIPVTLS